MSGRGGGKEADKSVGSAGARVRGRGYTGRGPRVTSRPL